MPYAKITDYLEAQEIKDLTRASDLRGALAVIASWTLIVGSFVLAARYPHPLTIAAALFILGGRHLALAILMHEASHRSLFANRSANDFIGKWLCAAPGWGDLERYRVHHLAHHAHTGTDADTDIGLVRPFPITKASLARKLLRDLIGITGLKRVFGLLAIDLGFVEYTASVDATPIDQSGRGATELLLTGARNLFPVVLTNGLLLCVLSLAGQPWLYSLWVISYLTTFSVFVRVRAMAEHACTGQSADPFANTRTTHANWLARLSVAPHRVNYHLEHHLLMTVPYFRLPELHRLLRKRGALEAAPVANGYGEVLRTVTTV
jgi:fatty acid desaturase